MHDLITRRQSNVIEHQKCWLNETHNCTHFLMISPASKWLPFIESRCNMQGIPMQKPLVSALISSMSLKVEAKWQNITCFQGNHDTQISRRIWAKYQEAYCCQLQHYYWSSLDKPPILPGWHMIMRLQCKLQKNKIQINANVQAPTENWKNVQHYQMSQAPAYIQSWSDQPSKQLNKRWKLHLWLTGINR